MRAYTYQIGAGVGDQMPSPSHAEALFADSLGEAIDKAKAVTRLRAPHANETDVRIVETGGDEFPVWASTVEAIRAG